MAKLPQGSWLSGRFVRLSPVVEADLPALAAILSEPRVYESGFQMHARPTSEAEALQLARSRYLAPTRRIGANPGRVSYSVRLLEDSAMGRAGELVGTSSLGEADLLNERVHLGWTLYHPKVWGTVVNPETKYLLLQHCFTDLGFGRVKIQTDEINTRAVRALTALGAHREGTLRRHMAREDGSFRNTVVFSVLADEWPQVATGLQTRIATLGGVS